MPSLAKMRSKSYLGIVLISFWGPCGCYFGTRNLFFLYMFRMFFSDHFLSTYFITFGFILEAILRQDWPKMRQDRPQEVD